MAKTSTLIDACTTINPAVWTASGSGGFSATATGVFRLQYPIATNAHCDLVTVATDWDLTNSSFLVEIPDPGTLQTGWSAEVWIGPSFSTNYLTIAVGAPFGLSATLNNGGGADEVFIYTGAGTYSPTTHRWLRIRETAGTIFWEYSADATTFTVHHSVPTSTATWSLAATTIMLTAGRTTAGTVDGYSSFDNINNASAAVTPKIETLTEAFPSGLPATWGSNNTGLVSASGGGIRLDHGADATYTYVYPSAGVWDLTGSYAMVEITDFDSSTTGQERGLEVAVNHANWVGLYGSGGQLRAYVSNADVITQAGAALTLDTVAHRCLRIREASGTIFFDTAPAGGTFTNRFSITNPFAVTAVYPQLAVGNYQGAAAGYAVFKNLNIASVAVVPPAAGWVTGFLPASGVTAPTPPPPTGGMLFPRLGNVLTSGPQNYSDTTYRAQIAKLDVAILGMYPGWNGGGGPASTPAAAIAGIKAINPDILIGNYTSVNEVATTGSNYQVLRDKLAAGTSAGGRDWYLYLANGSTHASSWAGQWSINLSLTATNPDGTGDRWPQWKAKWDSANLIPAGLDIWHSDNCFEDPPIDADWNCDGVLDGTTSSTVRNTMRDGYRAYYDTAKAQQPTKFLMVNTDSDMKGDVYPGGISIPQYTNVAHGAFLEVLWFLEERTNGWINMMKLYHAVFNNLLEPKIVLFQNSEWVTTDHQDHRHMFAACLMDNGYYCLTTDSYTGVYWRDEYDLNGTTSTKWMGAAIDPPQLTAWSSGVYRREFANALVLCNPRGNGSRTVSIGAGWHKVAGSRDPLNNGATVTSVTLADRDGLILVRS